MIAALDYLPVLDNQYLVGTSNRRKSMSDDKSGASSPEGFEAVLDHRLTLTVKTRSCLIKDQNPGISQDRSCDGDPLPLAT